jgi:hypothetical protein
MQSLVVTNSGFLSLIARFLPSQTIKRWKIWGQQKIP